MFPCRLTTFSGVSAYLAAAAKNLCGFCTQNVTLKIHLAISRVASENSEFLIVLVFSLRSDVVLSVASPGTVLCNALKTEEK